MTDWKNKHANDSLKALEHEIVRDVEREYIDNMRGYGVDLGKGLPSYGLHKVMLYVAQVARAQALGFDPDLLHATPAEATEAQLELARQMVEAGMPVTVIGDESILHKRE